MHSMMVYSTLLTVISCTVPLPLEDQVIVGSKVYDIIRAKHETHNDFKKLSTLILGESEPVLIISA